MPGKIQVLVATLISDSNRVEYRYTVFNGSRYPVSALLIGYDEYYGVPTLNGEPIGWDGETTPSSSFRAPPGWEFVVQPTEEESHIAVKWVISSPGRMAIAAGDSLAGFMVALERPDSAYDKGGLWTTYMMGWSPLFGAIRKAE